MFDAWLDELGFQFSDRVLPVDREVSDMWGRLNAPAPRKTIDSLIAATAIVHQLTVVTGNTRDFEACGVPVLDPRG